MNRKRDASTGILSSPNTRMLARPRVRESLALRAGLQLRVLCAPVGSGITSALLEYGRVNDGVVYAAPPPHSSRATIKRLLETHLDAREVLIDGADRIDAGGLDALLAFAKAGRTPAILIAGRVNSYE
jgi:hypothetical protein